MMAESVSACRSTGSSSRRLALYGYVVEIMARALRKLNRLLGQLVEGNTDPRSKLS
jgi:hypothetical protein